VSHAHATAPRASSYALALECIGRRITVGPRLGRWCPFRSTRPARPALSRTAGWIAPQKRLHPGVRGRRHPSIAGDPFRPEWAVTHTAQMGLASQRAH
jgi:hypothetical protein